jgi:hypothetical protein
MRIEEYMVRPVRMPPGRLHRRRDRGAGEKKDRP